MDRFTSGPLALALITEGFIPMDYLHPFGTMGSGHRRQEYGPGSA